LRAVAILPSSGWRIMPTPQQNPSVRRDCSQLPCTVILSEVKDFAFPTD
jgi:hypothetical protein